MEGGIPRCRGGFCGVRGDGILQYRGGDPQCWGGSHGVGWDPRVGGGSRNAL